MYIGCSGVWFPNRNGKQASDLQVPGPCLAERVHNDNNTATKPQEALWIIQGKAAIPRCDGPQLWEACLENDARPPIRSSSCSFLCLSIHVSTHLSVWVYGWRPEVLARGAVELVWLASKLQGSAHLHSMQDYRLAPPCLALICEYWGLSLGAHVCCLVFFNLTPELPGKRDPQLRKQFYHTGLWASLWGVFTIIIDVGGLVYCG